MRKVPFVKYTSYGNTFVMVDETIYPILTEAEKSICACAATNVCFGIGSDSFIVLQSCNKETLNSINETRDYWETVPVLKNADYIMRIFEPDGQESTSCGNGLMCIANYLHMHYGLRSASIVTEIPNTLPKVIQIGTDCEEKMNWANIGSPTTIPDSMVDTLQTTDYNGIVGLIENVSIDLRNNGLIFFQAEQPITINGYLIYTGEPHMVVFTENGTTFPDLTQRLFIAADKEIPRIMNAEYRENFGIGLVHTVGKFFNKAFRHVFPKGINVDFVNVIDENGILEYRCFERGIEQETLACGTGALACFSVAGQLGVLKSDNACIRPYRCRWHVPEAEMLVRKKGEDFLLFGNPNFLCRGEFVVNKFVAGHRSDPCMISPIRSVKKT